MEVEKVPGPGRVGDLQMGTEEPARCQPQGDGRPGGAVRVPLGSRGMSGGVKALCRGRRALGSRGREGHTHPVEPA